MEEKKEERRKNNERKIILMSLILMALIIIIFLFIKCIGLIDHRPLIPTGNVDIFDITFGGNCNCNCPSNDCDCPSGNGTNNNSGSYAPANGMVDDNDDDNNGVTVFDKETVYSDETPLNIFTQTAYYVVDDKIAPGTENAYQFAVRNNNEFNIKYSLDVIETNDYNINMQYRLKINGTYIAGGENEYVTAEELNQYDIELASNNYNVYTLDWKWVESKNDTEVGTNINSKYKLNLKITASGE